MAGGLEPELLTETPAVRAGRDRPARAAAYTPEWTDRAPRRRRRRDRHASTPRLAETAHQRLNRMPRRLALDYLRTAGVRPLPASPAVALAAVELADGRSAPVEVPAGIGVRDAGRADRTGAGDRRTAAPRCPAGSRRSPCWPTAGWLWTAATSSAAWRRSGRARSRPPSSGSGVDTVGRARRACCRSPSSCVPPPGGAVAKAAGQPRSRRRPLLRWEAMSARPGRRAGGGVRRDPRAWTAPA